MLLADAKSVLGELDRVTPVMKLLGFVNSTPGYDSRARVIDGCSELFHAVFGERGAPARSAIGVGIGAEQHQRANWSDFRSATIEP